MAGRATGLAERQAQQRQIDARFIDQAIQASHARNTGPGYFERESAGHAAEAYATQRNQAQLDAAADETAARREVGLAQASADIFREQARFASDAMQARAAADITAHRREQFKAAAAMGPEALQAFLAEDAFATGKSPVPAGYLEGASGTKGSGPDQRKDISQFQRGIEAMLSGGNAAGVLAYTGEKDLTAGLGAVPPGADAAQVAAAAPLSERAMQTIAGLQHVTGTMDQTQLRALRANLAGAPASEELKSAALTIVDGALQQRQKMRDVEIGQVYDGVLRKATEAILTDEKFASLPRSQTRAAVGREAIRMAKSYGISPAELSDFLSRMNNTPTP